ncbi:hypothetical protein [Paludisphaera borealis]|uniref:Uncharacterized protein n=1 Tax=Paludisphaera borealis TaxID=1387353 RepID=A0A1U7CR36_9BACT|nr:hypothetical protein [Paludisphaera borealis]APW61359.1 hypothetical protein BSF38_02873 [Paludisphaera borealis]
MNGTLVSDLGLGPATWLFLSFLGCVTLFFKFSRFWSIRNLDLILLFALVPGMMMIVGSRPAQPFAAYVLLFLGSAAWLVRCLVDLGFSRRPLLEPNLNASGLFCLSVGVLGLLLVETVSLPVEEGAARNPAEPSAREELAGRPPSPTEENVAVKQVLEIAPLPESLKHKPLQVILSRVLAVLAHLGLVSGLWLIGWKHFERSITGLSMAACYLLLPYSRVALVDSGQLIPSALIIYAVFWHTRPTISGLLIGLAAGWIPACLGLIALWAGFYKGKSRLRYLLVSVSVALACALLGSFGPGLSQWASALGARSIAEVGLLPRFEPRSDGSFWVGFDSSFRLPVLIGYLALVIVTIFVPARKDLSELISLSAALLVASQFWYLEKGGTLVLLYLPLAIVMMFRPTMNARRLLGASLQRSASRTPVSPPSS